jgi:hypothetical protein
MHLPVLRAKVDAICAPADALDNILCEIISSVGLFPRAVFHRKTNWCLNYENGSKVDEKEKTTTVVLQLRIDIIRVLVSKKQLLLLL